MRPGWDASVVLRQLLAETGATQEQFANAASMRRTDVNPYFTGRRTLGGRVAERFADAFTTLGIENAATRLRPPLQHEKPLRLILDRLSSLERRLDALQAEVDQRLGPDPYRGHLRSGAASTRSDRGAG